MSKYSLTFQSDEAAKKYEEVLYGSQSYDSFIWSLQINQLLKLFDNLRSTKKELVHLDFACGTGRVLSAVEAMTARSVGLDVSANMLSIARQKVRKATLVEGDILKEPDIVGHDYDVITVFRFFLNAEPELRKQMIDVLASRLRDHTSRLIFNIHGNSQSLRHLALAWHAIRGQHYAEMSHREVRTLVDQAGLQIEARYGFGISPALLHRTMLSPLARSIDRFASKLQFLQSFSYDVLFVCKPKQELL